MTLGAVLCAYLHINSFTHADFDPLMPESEEKNMDTARHWAEQDNERVRGKYFMLAGSFGAFGLLVILTVLFYTTSHTSHILQQHT